MLGSGERLGQGLPLDAGDLEVPDVVGVCERTAVSATCAGPLERRR